MKFLIFLDVVLKQLLFLQIRLYRIVRRDGWFLVNDILTLFNNGRILGVITALIVDEAMSSCAVELTDDVGARCHLVSTHFGHTILLL